MPRIPVYRPTSRTSSAPATPKATARAKAQEAAKVLSGFAKPETNAVALKKEFAGWTTTAQPTGSMVARLQHEARSLGHNAPNHEQSESQFLSFKPDGQSGPSDEALMANQRHVYGQHAPVENQQWVLGQRDVETETNAGYWVGQARAAELGLNIKFSQGVSLDKVFGTTLDDAAHAVRVFTALGRPEATFQGKPIAEWKTELDSEQLLRTNRRVSVSIFENAVDIRSTVKALEHGLIEPIKLETLSPEALHQLEQSVLSTKRSFSSVPEQERTFTDPETGLEYCISSEGNAHSRKPGEAWSAAESLDVLFANAPERLAKYKQFEQALLHPSAPPEFQAWGAKEQGIAGSLIRGEKIALPVTIDESPSVLGVADALGEQYLPDVAAFTDVHAVHNARVSVASKELPRLVADFDAQVLTLRKNARALAEKQWFMTPGEKFGTVLERALSETVSQHASAIESSAQKNTPGLGNTSAMLGVELRNVESHRAWLNEGAADTAAEAARVSKRLSSSAFFNVDEVREYSAATDGHIAPPALAEIDEASRTQLHRYATRPSWESLSIAQRTVIDPQSPTLDFQLVSPNKVQYRDKTAAADAAWTQADLRAGATDTWQVAAQAKQEEIFPAAPKAFLALPADQQTLAMNMLNGTALAQPPSLAQAATAVGLAKSLGLPGITKFHDASLDAWNTRFEQHNTALDTQRQRLTSLLQEHDATVTKVRQEAVTDAELELGRAPQSDFATLLQTSLQKVLAAEDTAQRRTTDFAELGNAPHLLRAQLNEPATHQQWRQTHVGNSTETKGRDERRRGVNGFVSVAELRAHVQSEAKHVQRPAELPVLTEAQKTQITRHWRNEARPLNEFSEAERTFDLPDPAGAQGRIEGDGQLVIRQSPTSPWSAVTAIADPAVTAAQRSAAQSHETKLKAAETWPPELADTTADQRKLFAFYLAGINGTFSTDLAAGGMASGVGRALHLPDTTEFQGKSLAAWEKEIAAFDAQADNKTRLQQLVTGHDAHIETLRSESLALAERRWLQRPGEEFKEVLAKTFDELLLKYTAERESQVAGQRGLGNAPGLLVKELADSTTHKAWLDKQVAELDLNALREKRRLEADVFIDINEVHTLAEAAPPKTAIKAHAPWGAEQVDMLKRHFEGPKDLATVPEGERIFSASQNDPRGLVEHRLDAADRISLRRQGASRWEGPFSFNSLDNSVGQMDTARALELKLLKPPAPAELKNFDATEQELARFFLMGTTHDLGVEHTAAAIAVGKALGLAESTVFHDKTLAQWQAHVDQHNATLPGQNAKLERLVSHYEQQKAQLRQTALEAAANEGATNQSGFRELLESHLNSGLEKAKVLEGLPAEFKDFGNAPALIDAELHAPASHATWLEEHSSGVAAQLKRFTSNVFLNAAEVRIIAGKAESATAARTFEQLSEAERSLKFAPPGQAEYEFRINPDKTIDQRQVGTPNFVRIAVDLTRTNSGNAYVDAIVKHYNALMFKVAPTTAPPMLGDVAALTRFLSGDPAQPTPPPEYAALGADLQSLVKTALIGTPNTLDATLHNVKTSVAIFNALKKPEATFHGKTAAAWQAIVDLKDPVLLERAGKLGTLVEKINASSDTLRNEVVREAEQVWFKDLSADYGKLLKKTLEQRLPEHSKHTEQVLAQEGASLGNAGGLLHKDAFKLEHHEGWLNKELNDPERQNLRTERRLLARSFHDAADVRQFAADTQGGGAIQIPELPVFSAYDKGRLARHLGDNLRSFDDFSQAERTFTIAAYPDYEAYLSATNEFTYRPTQPAPGAWVTSPIREAAGNAFHDAARAHQESLLSQSAAPDVLKAMTPQQQVLVRSFQLNEPHNLPPTLEAAADAIAVAKALGIETPPDFHGQSLALWRKRIDEVNGPRPLHQAELNALIAHLDGQTDAIRNEAFDHAQSAWSADTTQSFRRLLESAVQNIAKEKQIALDPKLVKSAKEMGNATQLLLNEASSQQQHQAWANDKLPDLTFGEKLVNPVPEKVVEITPEKAPLIEKLAKVGAIGSDADKSLLEQALATLNPAILTALVNAKYQIIVSRNNVTNGARDLRALSSTSGVAADLADGVHSSDPEKGNRIVVRSQMVDGKLTMNAAMLMGAIGHAYDEVLLQNNNQPLHVQPAFADAFSKEHQRLPQAFHQQEPFFGNVFARYVLDPERALREFPLMAKALKGVGLGDKPADGESLVKLHDSMLARAPVTTKVNPEAILEEFETVNTLRQAEGKTREPYIIEMGGEAAATKALSKQMAARLSTMREPTKSTFGFSGGLTPIDAATFNDPAALTKALNGLSSGTGGMLYVEDLANIAPNSKGFEVLKEYYERMGDLVPLVLAGSKEARRPLANVLKSVLRKTVDIEPLSADQVAELVRREVSNDGYELSEPGQDILFKRAKGGDYDGAIALWSGIKNEQFGRTASMGSEMRRQPKAIAYVLGRDVEAAKLPEKKDPIREIKELTGLKEVKEKIDAIMADVVLIKSEEDLGRQPKDPPRLNLLFSGNPGTGKTTVATKLGQGLYDAGFVKRNKVAKVTIQDLTSGNPEENVKKLFENNRDGVIFVDEMHQLKDTNEGKRAFRAMIPYLADPEYKRTVFIGAGYTHELNELVRDVDPGGERRFVSVPFADYSPEQFGQIADTMLKANKLTVSDDVKKALVDRVVRKQRSMKNPGNAGDVEVVIGLAREKQRTRLAELGKTKKLTHEDFDTLTVADFKVENAVTVDSVWAEIDKLKGLESAKAQLRDMQYLIELNKQLGEDPLSGVEPYLILDGPAGSGKSTLAGLIGKLFAANDIVPSADLVKGVGGDLTGGFIGNSTVLAVRKLFESGWGKTLFIDEIGALANAVGGYEQQAAKEILTQLENNRGKFILVIADYPHNIDKFLALDAGLPRRFGARLSLEGMTGSAAAEQLQTQLKTLKLDGDHLAGHIAKRLEVLAQLPGWASGGDVRTLANKVKTKQASVYMEARRNGQTMDVSKVTQEALDRAINELEADVRKRPDPGTRREPPPEGLATESRAASKNVDAPKATTQFSDADYATLKAIEEVDKQFGSVFNNNPAELARQEADPTSDYNKALGQKLKVAPAKAQQVRMQIMVKKKKMVDVLSVQEKRMFKYHCPYCGGVDSPSCGYINMPMDWKLQHSTRGPWTEKTNVHTQKEVEYQEFQERVVGGNT